MRFLSRLLVPFVPLLALSVALAPAGASPELSPRARDLVADAARLSDALWDARAGLLWNNEKHESHGVRASSWYVLGLMARDQPGDRERALAALRAVLAQQIDAPGAPWDGTFYRTAEESQPRHDAKIWHDYDPNWRQFIGSAFALLLLEYEDRIPVADREAIERSLERAVSGELQHGRLRPSYTNIALMHGFLQGYAGQRLNRPDWVRASETWIKAVHAEFAPHQSFDEFNSPTYYGVDLYGLALLRRHGATPLLRQRGAEMEAALWRDIAKFYHADLHNLAGPFDRTYGMDLQRYVSLTGVWLRLALPLDEVPLPPLATKMDHGRDFLFGPCFALLGAEIPADALPHFTQFSGERLLRRPIADGKRIATAWLGRHLMIGAEHTGLSREARGPTGQFRPATIHWRAGPDTLGWIALIQSPRVDAEASAHALSIRAIGD
ncbi:MAG TPA: hypothetical protein VNR00_17270, partial [Opitutus sp.]|nr:hypothetical protein [Opitutus sp.]